jgi:hypothetical protein
MVLAFILSIFALTGTVRTWHIFALSALLGVVNAFDMTARQAFIVELVEKEDPDCLCRGCRDCSW